MDKNSSRTELHTLLVSMQSFQECLYVTVTMLDPTQQDTSSRSGITNRHLDVQYVCHCIPTTSCTVKFYSGITEKLFPFGIYMDLSMQDIFFTFVQSLIFLVRCVADSSVLNGSETIDRLNWPRSVTVAIPLSLWAAQTVHRSPSLPGPDTRNCPRGLAWCRHYEAGWYICDNTGRCTC
jgi:hypothetical protein